MYITLPKQFKAWKVPAVVGSIVIVGALRCCALLHSVYDLEATQMNLQRCLTREIMLCEFELSHNTAEATKDIHYAKSEGVVDHSTIIR